MPESAWDKIKAIPKALDAAAGKPASQGLVTKPASPTLPDNTVVERKPLSTKDVNLPIKGSVLDRKASLVRPVGRGRSLTRRA